MESKEKRKSRNIEIRRAVVADVSSILEVAQAAYSTWSSRQLASQRNYEMQIKAFPEGQFVALIDGRLVGYCTSLIVNLDDDSPWYAHSEITGFGTFSTHNPAGNTLYGADIAVHPEFQGLGVSKKLYAARKGIMRRHNLKQMVAGGRIPGYHAYQGKLSPEEYVREATAGRLKDQALSAHIRAGYRIEGVHYGYIDDEQSLGYATHLVMANSQYRKSKRMVAAQPIKQQARRARICTVQYGMRRISGWEDFCDQVEYFADLADAYDSHILVMPELFIAQMLCTFPRGEDMLKMVRRLADLHPQYIDFFTRLAQSRGLYIVAGSVPLLREDGKMYNVGHMFSPGGNVYTQDKLHLTPAEARYWGLSAGQGLRVFDTPYGRIGILVCYDIEFPELSRLLVDAGVDIIIVPFATDERKSYQRVRYCAQARAVENMIYVVLSGNVGGLPRSPAMAVNFGQAAILTPSDFAFPFTAVSAEGALNTETVVVADVDLASLSIERQVSNVRPLIDRRKDIYTIKSSVQIEHVATH